MGGSTHARYGLWPVKLTIVGGGGFRVPLVYGALLNKRERLPFDEVVLHDLDQDRMDRMATVLHGLAAERQLLAALLGEPVQDGGHPLHPALVEIVQHDLVERQARALGQQRPVDERDAEPSSADDRELHGERPYRPLSHDSLLTLSKS